MCLLAKSYAHYKWFFLRRCISDLRPSQGQLNTRPFGGKRWLVLKKVEGWDGCCCYLGGDPIQSLSKDSLILGEQGPL